jgi:predicted nuclease with TOPRIM domain
MSCTTAVFTLMAGASILAGMAIYSYWRSLMDTHKQKANSLNVALSNLQEERRSAIEKSDNLFAENASQSSEIERMNQELVKMKMVMNRMEHDNQLILEEYSRLESSVKVNRSYVTLNGNGQSYGNITSKDLALF